MKQVHATKGLGSDQLAKSSLVSPNAAEKTVENTHLSNHPLNHQYELFWDQNQCYQKTEARPLS